MLGGGGPKAKVAVTAAANCPLGRPAAPTITRLVLSKDASLVNNMDVFISWSGERSRCAAEALRTWLPKVINAIKPWLSVTDVEKGSRWSTDIASRLEQSKLGIICLTKGNLHSDWILFEAGALSKTLQNTYVCPLLFELQPADVKGPLAQFQATRAIKEEIRKLLQTINSAIGDQSLSEAHLSEAFDVWWPKLERQFGELPAEEAHESPARPDREILEEILALMRSQARSVAAPAPERTPLKAELRMVDESKPSKPSVPAPFDVSPAKAEAPEPVDDYGNGMEKR